MKIDEIQKIMDEAAEVAEKQLMEAQRKFKSHLKMIAWCAAVEAATTQFMTGMENKHGIEVKRIFNSMREGFEVEEVE